MRFRTFFLVFLGSLHSIAGCRTDDGATSAGPSPPPSLQGEWQAANFELRMVADSSVWHDWVAAGARVSLTLRRGPEPFGRWLEGGTGSLTWDFPGKEALVQTGEWRVAQDTVYMYSTDWDDWETDFWWHHFILSDGSRRLDLVEERSGFDFDHCGQEEAARVHMTFVRQ